MGLSARRDIEEYDSYLTFARDSLLRDFADPARNQVLRDMIAGLEVTRVLDVGCGIGQFLFPLAISKGALGVGLDVSNKACRLGKEIYAANISKARVVFVLGRAEFLPFAPASFDVVSCVLTLPYTNNARTFSEIARVLRPGGLFILNMHHLRYYLRELWQALISGKLLTMTHAGRVLMAGTIYHLFGRQPQSRLLNETFQTKWFLRKQLSRRGLEIYSEHPHSNPLAPTFVISQKP